MDLKEKDLKKPIIIEVTGIKENRGHLLFSVFAKKDGFPNDIKKAITYARVKPELPVTKIEFLLEPGISYAVAVLHDLDENGKMSYGFMLPKEPFGFSNNSKIVFKAPGFEDAAFVFSGNPGSKQTIKLKQL